MEIQDARSLSPSAQEALRKRAVRAHLEGLTQQEVADLLKVSRGAVAKWYRLYKTGGESALSARRRGRRKGIQLLPWQAATIVRIITDRTPDQIKLPFVLWTRDAVAQLIWERYGIKLSRWTVGRYLRRWGLTPQKPARRAIEQNPEAVREWLEKEYPTIRRRAKREKAEIHWGDEMGIRSDHQSGRTWGIKGQTPVVSVTAKRFGCNMISTITNRGTLRFMLFKERFTADVFITFLRRLIRSADRKVYLIVDNISIHKARKVKKWFEKHKERIAIFYLPPYSPERNPDELLNNDVKNNATKERRPRNEIEMKRCLNRYLMSTQKHPGIVRNYFRGEYVSYAAA